MALRTPKVQRPSPHVTVFTTEGTPVRYPKAQIHRIDKSERLHLEDPTAEPEPAEESRPEPESKPKPKGKKETK